MTNMELAYRKAEITEALSFGCGMHTNSNRGWHLMSNLVKDLIKEGVSRGVAWKIVLCK